MIAVEHPHELEHSKARPIAPMPPTSACDAPSPMHSQDCPLHRVANQKVLQMVREKRGWTRLRHKRIQKSKERYPTEKMSAINSGNEHR